MRSTVDYQHSCHTHHFLKGCMRNYEAHFRAVPSTFPICPAQSSRHQISAGGHSQEACLFTAPHRASSRLYNSADLHNTATAQSSSIVSCQTLLRPENSQTVHKYRLCGVHKARKRARNSLLDIKKQNAIVPYTWTNMYMMHHTGDARCDKSALLEAPTPTPDHKYPARLQCQSRMLLNACTALTNK
jgi:hypothetical protein